MLDRELQHQDDLDRMHARDARRDAEAPAAGIPDLGRVAAADVQLRRKATGAAAVSADAARGIAEQGLGGPAHELPHRAAMEERFGTSLADVRAHTGEGTRHASRAIGAEAYTLGNQVGFASANPSVETVAHEVTHVMQQTRGGGARSEAEDEAEAHAAERGAAPAHAGGSGATALRKLDATDDTTEAPALDPAQSRSAIAWNRGRNLPADAWSKIGAVVGAKGAEIDDDMVQAIAAWQKAQGLGADGKVGEITLQWLSQRPGGEGLEALVKSDATVYLGLNPNSRGVELETLKSTGADVTGLTGAKKQDTAQVAGRSVDLNSEEGLAAFLGQFPRLGAAQQEALKDFVGNAGGSSKDELAQLAGVFYSAETGARLIKRMVLSGHSAGTSIWGDDNGWVQFSHLTALATIFPNAVGQVEDLMMSACNTGQTGKLDQYTAIFPNLKSIWAYVGYSPSAATGSTRHIKEWEKGSRGAMNHDKLDGSRERVAAGSGPRDQNVALWTRENGAATPQYETASEYATHDFETLKAAVDSAMPSYHDAYDRGNIDLTALSGLYTQLQALTGMHQGSLGGDYDRYVLVMKHVLILRHWTNIQRRFWAEHGAAATAAYGNQQVPAALKSGTRAQALAAIAAFAGDQGSEGFQLIKGILGDLDPAKIPDNWI